MLTIVIPAAGDGARFRAAGYESSKPLINVCGKPMIQRVMENIAPTKPHRFVIVSRLHHDELAPLLGYDDVAIHLSTPTEGAIDTLLRAKHHITYEPLLIANCDQLAAFDIDTFIKSAHGTDGTFVTFRSANEHHSYVKLDIYGRVTSIVEKQVVSSHAMTGIYYFSRGLDFVNHCEQVMAHNDRSANNEFYLSSAIARMINDGRRFVTYDASTAILGTPSELQLFEVGYQFGESGL